MADILSPNAPALSATTDMPVIDPNVAPAPVTTEPQPTVPQPTTESTTTTPATTTAAPQQTPFIERISELTTARREAMAKAAEAEAALATKQKELEDAQRALEEARRVQQQQPSHDELNPRPTRDAFADDADYEAAIVTWASDRAVARAQEAWERRQTEQEEQRLQREREAAENETRRAQAETARQHQQEIESAWEEKQKAGRTAHEDFDTVVGNPALAISEPMALTIKTLESGDEVAYYLGKNPQEAARIAGMVIPGVVFPTGHPQAGLPVPNAVAQAFALGRIAQTLTGNSNTTSTNTLATPAPVPTPPSATVPIPPTPISVAPMSATTSTDEPTMEEYAARRMPQLAAERRPGRVTH